MTDAPAESDLDTGSALLLTVNTGSSSLKASTFRVGAAGEPSREATIEIDRIGAPNGRMRVGLAGK